MRRGAEPRVAPAEGAWERAGWASGSQGRPGGELEHPQGLSTMTVAFAQSGTGVSRERNKNLGWFLNRWL